MRFRRGVVETVIAPWGDCEHALRVFLSFNSMDLALALAVRAGLARLEPDVEFFFSPDSLGAGFWLPKLAEEIGAADAFLLLVGPSGLGPWQEVEYYTAFDRHVKDKAFALVPAILAGAEAPGLSFLRSLNWVVAPLATEDRTLHRLVAALSGESVAQATPLWKLINPYRGLEAMTEANADYFFARDAETAAVLRSLAEQPDRCPILIGASGVGKSSVAQAGVLSALKAMRLPGRDESRAGAWPSALENSRGWGIVTLRPGEAPLDALAAAMTRPWIDLADPDQVALRRKLAVGLGRGDYTLPDLIETMQARLLKQEGVAPDRVLIYLDQGEELYTRAPPQEAERFSTLLAEALPDKRLLFFASLRADYFDRLQADQPLFAGHAHVNVPPLDPGRLHEVVRAPARALDVAFEDSEIADRIVQAAAAQAGALPLLSYLLTDMWAGMVQRDDGILRLPAHAIDIGGVLARRAEEFLQQHPGDEAALRRLLTLRLATVPSQGEPVRRQTTRAECSEREWSLAARLGEYPWRLVVMRAREGDAEIIAEVAHEALLRAWPRLAAWLREERDFLVFKGEAERAEQRWTEMGQPDRALLSGLDLGRADEWLRARADDLPTDVREFAQRSIATDRATKEKQLRVQRRLSLIAEIAALVMAVISAVAWVQWDRARKAEETARNAAAAAVENAAVALENEGRALAALSRVAASKGSFADSVHLALAAWPRTPADRRPRLPTVLDSLSLGLSTLVPVRAEFRHDAWVSGALLTRDEARLLSWSGDKTLRLWEVATGRQIGPAMMHDEFDHWRVAHARRDPHPVVVP